MTYIKAIPSLSEAHQDAVSAVVASWASSSDDKHRRLSTNICTETALEIHDFISLLTAFAENLLAEPKDPILGWKKACYGHQQRGRPLPSPIPTILGRACALRDYADNVSQSPGSGMTLMQAERLIRDVSVGGQGAHERELNILRRSRIGKYIIWATFNATQPDQGPFVTLPPTTEAIRTALGLGECPQNETLALLTYKTLHEGAMLVLHRPTVAEAAGYCWYRPHPNPNSPHGLTEPLSPNPAGWQGQPEVIHKEINGQNLVFPLILTV